MLYYGYSLKLLCFPLSLKNAEKKKERSNGRNVSYYKVVFYVGGKTIKFIAMFVFYYNTYAKIIHCTFFFETTDLIYF